MGTHSAFGERSHTRAHTAKQGPSGRGRYHYPRHVLHVHEHPRAGCQNGVLCRFGILPGRCSRRTQRAFGTAMRLCASLSRGAAAPLGCVIFFRFCRNYGFHTLYSGLFACARRGWYHYPRHALHVLETLDGRLSKGRICRFLRSTDIIDSSGAKAETASHAEQLRFPAKGTGAVFYVTSWSVPGTRRSALLCKRRWDRTCRCPRRW